MEIGAVFHILKWVSSISYCVTTVTCHCGFHNDRSNSSQNGNIIMITKIPWYTKGSTVLPKYS